MTKNVRMTMDVRMTRVIVMLDEDEILYHNQ